MLQSLRIQNFALIDFVELSFNSGFTAITGETGSGKSILLSALNLILGERADFSVIGPASDKSIVEAEFQLKSFHLEELFKENDLDFNEITNVRREINSNGKSRAFINDTPVSLNILKDLSSQLINIHSQYNTLELKNKNYQLEILDTLAGLRNKKSEFSIKYKNYLDRKHELEELKRSLSQVLQRQDYNKFQLEELEELNLDKNDFTVLEAEFKKSENSEIILNALNSVLAIVENENSVQDQLSLMRSNLDKLKGLDLGLDDLSERINSVMIELVDISSDASKMLDSVETDPERLQMLTNLLNKYNHILKKHNLTDQPGILGFKESLENEVLDAEETQNKIIYLESDLDKLQKALQILADELHNARKESVSTVSFELKNILEELKLPYTKLDFNLTKRDEFNQFGNTDIALLFSANVGIDPVPIEKAASGGELSRVMLALQKMISEKKVFPTVLFDEIDTGVSGDVAQKIGTLLQKMGTHFQLIAITHLPQVAAKATSHFKVEKEIENNRTSTMVLNLNPEERVEEIARLMSGEHITDAAKENAKALMN